jgi:hypothetical protein
MKSAAIFHSSVTVDERLLAIKRMDVAALKQALQCDDIQGSVRIAAGSRLRTLARKVVTR